MSSQGNSDERRENPSVGNGGRWILISIAVVLLVSVLVGAFILTVRTHANETQGQIQQRLQAIRATGQPLTEGDLLRIFPDPPPERDAYRILKDPLSRLAIPSDPTKLPFFSETSLRDSGELAAPVKAEIVKCLNQNQGALTNVAWDQLEIAWISSGLAGGFTNITNSALSPMLQLIKLLCLEAVLSADDYAPHEAAQDLLRALMVGRTLRDDLPIHHFANASSQVRVCESLEHILNRTSLTSQDLQQLEGALTLTNLAAVKQDIMFERCFGLFAGRYTGSLASQMRSSVTGAVQKLARVYESRIFYQDDDLLQYLGWSQRCLEALDMPVSNAVSRLRHFEAEHQRGRHVSFLDGIRRRGPSLLSMLEVQVSSWLLREAEAVARVRLTTTVLAIERWRLNHAGSLPKKLSDLVPAYFPAQPTDPFNDLPFNYRRLSPGYVVYSVGPDFVDEGDKERPSNQDQSTHHDITFTVKR